MKDYPTNLLEEIKTWQDFRTSLSSLFPRRKNSIMDLIDSNSCHHSSSSPVELSTSELFPRNYSSVYKAINQSFYHSEETGIIQQRKQVQQLIFSTIKQEINFPFYLLGIDVTPAPRPYSGHLKDRGYIYQPNTISGNKPINIGHKYSVLSYLTKDKFTNHNWAIPLEGKRVTSFDTDLKIGKSQIITFFDNCDSDIQDKLSVLVGDTAYSNKDFLSPLSNYQNLVIISRVRSDRVFYRAINQDNRPQKKSGHPTWYGDKFDLKDPQTWWDEDEQFSASITNKKGENITINIKCWNNLVMKGDRINKMHQAPFRLLQISLTDENGKLVKKPMWLIIFGNRRNELNLLQCYQCYCQRYDLEHLFRFAKNKLLLNKYLTTDEKRAENWFNLALLSYVNLWAARKLAINFPRPWEKYNYKKTPSKITPSIVQKDLKRIIRTFGEKPSSPKPRGYSSGRKKGEKLPTKIIYPIVKKQYSKKKAS